MVSRRVLSLFLLLVTVLTAVSEAKANKKGRLSTKLSHIHGSLQSHHKAKGHAQRKDDVIGLFNHRPRDQKTGEANEEQEQSPISEMLKNPTKIDESEKQQLDQLQDYNNKQFVSNDMASETAELANHGIDDDSALRISNMAALPNGYRHGNSAASKAVIGLGNGLRASYGKDFDQDSMLYDESKWPEYRIKDSDYSQFPTFAEPVYNGNPNQGDFYDPQMGGSPFDQGVMPEANTFSNGPRLNKENKPTNQDLGLNGHAPRPAMGHTVTGGKIQGPKKVVLNKFLSHGNKGTKPPSVSVGENVDDNVIGIKMGKNHPGNSNDPGTHENDIKLTTEQETESSEQIGNGQLQHKPTGELEGQSVKTKLNTSHQTGNKSASNEISENNLISTGAPVDNAALPLSGNISSTSANDVKQGLNQAGQKGNETKGSVMVTTHDVKQGVSVVKQGGSVVTQSGNDVIVVGNNLKKKGNGNLIPVKQPQGAINIKEAIKEAVKAQAQSRVGQGIKEAQDQLVAPNQVQPKANLQKTSPITSQGTQKAQIRS